MSRDLFVREALKQIPKILTLLDRNPHSPTYGCFDRNFWHDQIKDFPNGRLQELVWPLTLAYGINYTDNPYYQQAVIKDWVEAGILYTIKSSHPDSFCPEYYPTERSISATAFSLLGCIESYDALGLMSYEALNFFEKRAHGLAHCAFSHCASNEAVIILCLERLSQLLQTSKWHRIKQTRLEHLLSLQNSEGWFQENQGLDPGYHSLTISLLAQLDYLKPNSRLKEPIQKAVELATHLIHPDGSYGGEYGSLNTYLFFPDGFELVGEWLPDALRINDRFLQGLKNNLIPCYTETYLFGYHTSNYLLAWLDFISDRPYPLPRDVASIWLKDAQILIKRRPYVELYVALNKGGAFKLFRENKLVVSDTQFSVQVRQDRLIKNAVCHLMSDYEISVKQDEIIIQGGLSWVTHHQRSSKEFIVSRILGLLFPKAGFNLNNNKIGQQNAPFQFIRRFRWEINQWYITDELYANSWEGVISVGIGGDQTSMDFPMSRTFQRGQLQPWLDLTDEIRKLLPGQPLKVERHY